MEKDWILVSDRLPSGSCDVMVYSVGEPGAGIAYYSDVDGKFYMVEIGFNQDICEYYGVTHWMGLPQPPKC